MSNDTKQKSSGFTLIELLVVIAIIALLLAILMPALGKAKEIGKAVVCMTHLRSCHTVIQLFGYDYDNKFPDADWDDDNQPDPHGQWWIQPMMTYSESPDLFVCPKAIRHPAMDTNGGMTGYPKNNNEHWGSKVPASKPANIAGEINYGSLAPNAWIMDTWMETEEATWGRPANLFWKSLTIINGSEVPLFLDCYWVDAWPENWHTASVEENQRTQSMHNFALNRHGGAVNSVFADGSTRKVGLKGLWRLKWHKNFNTNNAQNQPGAVWH